MNDKTVEIVEPVNSESVIVKINIPIRFNLSGKHSQDEYKKAAIERLQNFSNTCFKHVALLGFLAEHHDWEAYETSGIFTLLGDVGCGLIESMEGVEMQFDESEAAK